MTTPSVFSTQLRKSCRSWPDSSSSMRVRAHFCRTRMLDHVFLKCAEHQGHDNREHDDPYRLCNVQNWLRSNKSFYGVIYQIDSRRGDDKRLRQARRKWRERIRVGYSPTKAPAWQSQSVIRSTLWVRIRFVTTDAATVPHQRFKFQLSLS